MSRAALSSLFQHTAITAGVTVRVAVNFMPEQSRVGAGRWFWVYHIRIENGVLIGLIESSEPPSQRHRGGGL